MDVSVLAAIKWCHSVQIYLGCHFSFCSKSENCFAAGARESGNKNIPRGVYTWKRISLLYSAMVMYHLTGHFETNPLISRYELCSGSIKIHLSYCPVNHLAPADYVLVMSFRPRAPTPFHRYHSPTADRFGCSPEQLSSH